MRLSEWRGPGLVLGACLAPAASALVVSQGDFQTRIGGRIDFDVVAYHNDVVTDSKGGAFLRRAYVNLDGRYDTWRFRFGTDFSSAFSPTPIREMWVGTRVPGGELSIGQRKPPRGLEDLTESEDMLMMERPFAGTGGIYGTLCRDRSCVSTATRTFLPGLHYTLYYRFGQVGAAAYNLHPAGEFANEGVGGALRIVLVPVSHEDLTVHLAVSGVVDNAQGRNALRARVAYAGRDSSTQADGPSRTIAIGGAGARQETVGAEVAVAAGAFLVQGEFAQATFRGAGGPGVDEDVHTGYLQAGWMLTGGRRTYSEDRAVFRAPSLQPGAGAWELAARYDIIRNLDRTPAVGTSICEAPVLGPDPACEATSATVGINYYVNRALRIMLNHVQGHDRVIDDRTSSTSLRLQLSF